jgi:hypothetical protein
VRHRRRSTAEIIRRDRLAQGLAGVAIAAAALLKVAGAPTWAAISAAAVGLALAATRVGLEIFRSSSEVDESREQMLRVPPIRVGDLADRAGFYELGVETEALQALRALGSHDKHADYVRRDIDEALRRRLQRAVEVGGVSLIVVSGPPTAGKSRTLAEGLVATVPDAWLLAPRGRKGVDELARGRDGGHENLPIGGR